MRRATAAQGTRCVGRDARGRRSVGPVPPTDLDSRDQPPEDLAARGRWRNRAPLLVIAAMTLAGALSVVWGVFNQDTLEPLDAASRDRLRQTCVSEQQQAAASLCVTCCHLVLCFRDTPPLKQYTQLLSMQLSPRQSRQAAAAADA